MRTPKPPAPETATRQEAERIAETDEVASAIGYMISSQSANAAVDLVHAVMNAGVAANQDENSRSTVSIDLAYLQSLENHCARADKILEVAREVYDEFQKKIAHADNGAQLLEALHRLHVELHK